MAWAEPFGHFSTGYILDRDSINWVLATYQWEFSYLNEQNWDSGPAGFPELDTISDAGKLADDWAMTLYINRGGVTLGKVSPYHTGADAAQLVESTTWDEVDGTGKTISTRGGKFLIIASFQLSNLINDYGKPGHFFAIGIDDNPMVESLIGSGDTGNDVMDFPTLRVRRGNTTAANPASPSTLFVAFPGAGPGLKANQIGLTTRLMVHLEPGTHKISLMHRSLFQSSTSETDYITCRNLIIVETHDDL